MLDVLKFIFKCIANLITLLFEIDLGFTSLGGLMCIIVFIFPLVLMVVNMLKIKIRSDN